MHIYLLKKSNKTKDKKLYWKILILNFKNVMVKKSFSYKYEYEYWYDLNIHNNIFKSHIQINIKIHNIQPVVSHKAVAEDSE